MCGDGVGGDASSFDEHVVGTRSEFECNERLRSGDEFFRQCQLRHDEHDLVQCLDGRSLVRFAKCDTERDDVVLRPLSIGERLYERKEQRGDLHGGSGECSSRGDGEFGHSLYGGRSDGIDELPCGFECIVEHGRDRK